MLSRRKPLKGNGARGVALFAEKVSDFEVCPKCATPSRSVYDRRWVKLRDDPLRGGQVVLWVKKRRFSCAPCKRPFTEPVAGVRKGYRTTERYRRRLLWACERFSDMKAVREAYRCSSALLQRVLYEQLELQRRMRQYPWPTRIGIDEHLFKHDPRESPMFKRAARAKTTFAFAACDALEKFLARALPHWGSGFAAHAESLGA